MQCTGVTRTGRACGAHRVLELTACCFVCGAHSYARVPPNVGDLPEIYADLALLVADLIDVDPIPEHHALAAALADATIAYYRGVPVRELPPV